MRLEAFESKRPIRHALSGIAEYPDDLPEPQGYDRQIITAHTQNRKADEKGNRSRRNSSRDERYDEGDLDNVYRPDCMLNDEIELLFRRGHRQQRGSVSANRYETVRTQMKKAADAVYQVVADRKGDEDSDIIEYSDLIARTVAAE